MLYANNNLYTLENIFDKFQGNGYRYFSDFSKDVIQSDDNGKNIDEFIPVMGNWVIQFTETSNFHGTVFKLKVERLKDIKKMMLDANGIFVIPIINLVWVVYNDFEVFPLARIYEYYFNNESEFTECLKFIENNGLIIETEEFYSKLVDEKNAIKRQEIYLQDIEQRFEKLKRYLEGKYKNTSLKKGIAIAKKDFRCSICNTEDISEIENVSITNYISGIDFVMEVCKSCLSEDVTKNKILSLVFQHFNYQFILTKNKIDKHEIINISKNIVSIFLECEIINLTDESTFKGVRKSGYYIVFRLDAFDDYAYNVFSPDDQAIVRFDSAPDHPDKVEFMPHHVHNDLQEEKKISKELKKVRRKKNKEKIKMLKRKIDITDSFLSGFLGIDYMSLRKRITEYESSQS